MNMIEIADNIFFVEGNNAGRYIYANSLLIRDRKNLLIDSGIGREHIATLTRENRIDLLLISHGHEDHICGNDLLGPNTEIAVHKLDAPVVRSVEKLIDLYCAKDHPYRESMALLMTETFSLKDSIVDTEFTDGQTFDLGSNLVEAVHTPGHSAGHTCFFIPAAKIIFLGDIDLSSFGPWYGCHDSDIDTFLESIEKVKTIDFETAVSSHKGLLHGKKQIDEKLDRYREKIISREDDLLTLLAKEKTIDEIINKAIIYGRFPEPAEMFAINEKMMIAKHLHRLLNQGRIRQSEEGLFKAV